MTPEAPHSLRGMEAVLASVQRFEEAHQHACDIEMKARETIAAFRATERKWEKINGK